jgi:hypothetical protein
MTFRVDTAAAPAAMKKVLRELIVGAEYHKARRSAKIEFDERYRTAPSTRDV